MKLETAKVIMQEVTAWVNFHLKKGPKPERPFDRSLGDIVTARDKVLLNNLWLTQNKKEHKVMPVPNEQFCAALFIASSVQGMEEDTQLTLSTYDGKELVLYGPEKKQVIIDPNQLSIEDAIAQAKQSGNGQLIIVR